MAKTNVEGKVGLFVFVGLVLAVLLLLQFSKGTTLFRSTYELRLLTSNVAGLKERSTILLSGVPVGHVTKVALDPDGRTVTVFLEIFDKYSIHGDARFVIEQSGFLGDQYVSIIPMENEEAPLTDGAIVRAEAPFNIQEAARAAAGFINRIDEAAKRINSSIERIDRLVLNEETLSDLSATAVNFRLASARALHAMDEINTLIATNRSPVSDSVSNIHVFSENISQLANGLQSVLATNSEQITAAIKNIESSTETLHGLMIDLEQGKGLAGRILKDDGLADHFSIISSNLSVTSSNLNRLGLWGILWEKKPTREKPRQTEPLYQGRTPF